MTNENKNIIIEERKNRTDENFDDDDDLNM